MNKLKEFTVRKQELHCSIAIPYIRYLEELYGIERMKKIVEPLGLSIAYLKNKNNWMSFSYYNKLLAKVVKVTGDKLAPYYVPLMINPTSYFDFLMFLVYNKLWAGSPKWIYKIVIKEYKRYSKTGVFKILSITRNSLTAEARFFKEYKQTKNNCYAIQGFLASIPMGMGLAPAEITEKQCAAKGAPSCIYIVKWKRKINWFVLISLPLVVGIIIAQLVLFKDIFNYKDILLVVMTYLLIFFINLSYNFRKELIFREKISQRTKHYLNQNIKRIEKDYNKILKLQQQFYQSQKMEALGRIAGGLAHDINNILTILNGNIECVMMRIKKNNPAIENINEIKKAVKRASELTKQLMTFAKRGTYKPIKLNVNKVLKELSKMIKSIIGEGIELSVIPSKDLGNIRIDKNQLERVLLNIIVNAKDAMPSGGKLTITTQNISLAANTNYKFNELIPGKYVLIIISDNGKGIKKQDLQDIFDPFYTTKNEKTRTGLGLAICYNLVKQNNGYIFVESKYGKGTHFYIYLPIITADTQTKEQPEEKKILPKRNETILFVEDEAVLRTTYAGILENFGYQIIQAGSGQQALEFVKENLDIEIDLLLTDVIMPKMNGYDLAKQVKKILPNIKILFISGHADDIIDAARIKNLGSILLNKPFESEKLLTTIHTILSNRI